MIPSLTLPRALDILAHDRGETPETVLAAWRMCVEAARVWNIPVRLETSRDLADFATWVDSNPVTARQAARAYAHSHHGADDVQVAMFEKELSGGSVQ